MGENDRSGGKSGISVKLIGRGGNCKSFGESIGSVGKSNLIGSGGNSNLLGMAQLSKASGSKGKVGSIVSKSSGSVGNSAKAAEPEIKLGSKSSGSKGNSAWATGQVSKSGEKAGSDGKPRSGGRSANCSIN